MRKIKWYLQADGSDRIEDEFEVEDNATTDEIEAMAKDHVFNFVDWGWIEESPPKNKRKKE